LGQVLGGCFDAHTSRVAGYSLNVGGSLAGIIGFSGLSMLQAPPAVWFIIVGVGVGYLLLCAGDLTAPRVLTLAVLPLVLVLPEIRAQWTNVNIRWSPYYAVTHYKNLGAINVNNVGHQTMVPFEEFAAVYSLPHLLQ